MSTEASTGSPERHARTRALERYGFEITPAEMLALESRLAAGEGMLLSRHPDGQERRVIRFRGELVTLVFGKNGFIWTFLPRDAPMNRLWRSVRR